MMAKLIVDTTRKTIQIIWDRRTEYNSLRPLGYPSRSRVNKVHEYALIFQKPTGQHP